MSTEPELRRDPVTGRWALVAPERAMRPIALCDAGPRHRTAEERTPCPFCAGQEFDTPNEVFAFRDAGTEPNGPGWRLRVVPNKFPAVRRGGPSSSPAPYSTELGAGRGTLFCTAPAAGSAEVLIDCPEHIDDPTRLSDEQFRDVLRAYRSRLVELASDPALEYVAVFKNVGAEAGASLGHTHSQIVALPIVPELIHAELTGALAHFAHTRRCVYCDLIRGELADGVRVVARSEHFAAVMAFAPRFAYEMWVLPLTHASRYESITDDGVLELARLLKSVLRALDGSQRSPAYNWYLHTAPLRAGELAHYHWHLEIIPRTGRPAGLEWGSGCHITTAAPEGAASELRAALPPATVAVG
jgi:UDPglucose--hexose-1-phosphate uridylyltransferase